MEKRIASIHNRGNIDAKNKTIEGGEYFSLKFTKRVCYDSQDGFLYTFFSTYRMIFLAISVSVAFSIPSKPGEELTSNTSGPLMD